MPDPKPTFTDGDLELLLREADRDDPILSAPRTRTRTSRASRWTRRSSRASSSP